jgi:hypothetical protein
MKQLLSTIALSVGPVSGRGGISMVETGTMHTSDKDTATFKIKCAFGIMAKY